MKKGEVNMPHQSNDSVHTNFQMERMVESLKPLLNRADVVGYVAARNVRSLQGELEEYFQMKNKFITDLGTEELDDSGNPTGNISIKVGSREFDTFLEKMNPIAEARCYPTLFKLDPDECIDRLSGEQMLEYEWMIDYDDGGEKS